MAMSTRVCGTIIRQAVMGTITIQRVQTMKAFGFKICNMDMGRRLGKMDLTLRVNINLERSVDMGDMCGLMALSMKASGLIT